MVILVSFPEPPSTLGGRAGNKTLVSLHPLLLRHMEVLAAHSSERTEMMGVKYVDHCYFVVYGRKFIATYSLLNSKSCWTFANIMFFLPVRFLGNSAMLSIAGMYCCVRKVCVCVCVCVCVYVCV